MVAVYVNGDIEKKLERIREWIGKQTEKERVIVGGALAQEREQREGEKRRTKRGAGSRRTERLMGKGGNW